jgi:hypothetical protein
VIRWTKGQNQQNAIGEAVNVVQGQVKKVVSKDAA